MQYTPDRKSEICDSGADQRRGGGRGVGGNLIFYKREKGGRRDREEEVKSEPKDRFRNAITEREREKERERERREEREREKESFSFFFLNFQRRFRVRLWRNFPPPKKSKVCTNFVENNTKKYKTWGEIESSRPRLIPTAAAGSYFPHYRDDAGRQKKVKPHHSQGCQTAVLRLGLGDLASQWCYYDISIPLFRPFNPLELK